MSQSAAFARLLSGHAFKSVRVTGDKITRAAPLSSQWQAGNVAIVRGPWLDQYLAELEGFPDSKFDDQVDASSDAFDELAPRGKPIEVKPTTPRRSMSGWLGQTMPGISSINFGDAAARLVAQRTHPVADLTALAALSGDYRGDGDIRVVLSDGLNYGSIWQYSSSSTVTDATSNFAVTPSDSTGAWIRLSAGWMRLAISYSTADAAQLFLVPTGYNLMIDRIMWEVTTGFTGGTNAAIGVSSDATGWSTKGDLLGGAGGDVTATLGTAKKAIAGTAGAMGTALLIPSAKKIRFDRIVDQFAAGAGFVRVRGQLLAA